ncbi:MAG: phosphohydrolase, partial [Thalassolituus sp. CG17_big_fil_post_rev_8_21_14_2_50_53_8]
LKPKVIMILGPDKQPQPERIVNLSMAPADDCGVPYQPQGVFRSGCFGVHVNDYINRGLRIKGFEYAM